MPESPMSSTAPILTDALIDRVMREQRQQLRPPSGWGYSGWPMRVEQALATLTAEGWCQLGWIERANHRKVTMPLRYQVRWQVDTGEVRLEREQQR
jgi:hypothetical protein